MIRINKNIHPNSLIAHKKNGGTFINLPTATKRELRINLIQEQGFICCYCLKRIPENKKQIHHTKIEHFKCQEKYPELELDYNNLHLACRGNEGSLKQFQTCDTYKGSEEIKSFSLIDNSLKNTIKYASNGTILSDDPNIDRELNEVLRLNDQNFKAARASILKALSKNLNTLNKKGKFNVKYLDREVQKWSARYENKHKAFFPVAVYYLAKKINQNN